MRARLIVAERELSEAQRTIRRLRGEVPHEVPLDHVDPLTGVPGFLRLERKLPFAITDDGLVAITDMLESRVPGGAVSHVGPSWSHRRRTYEMKVHRTTAETTVELTCDHRGARTLLLVGAPGLALVAGVLGAILAAGLSGGSKLAIGLGVAMGALAAVAGLRALLRRDAARERKLVSGSFEAALDLARAHAPSAAGQRLELAEHTEQTPQLDEAELVEESAFTRGASQ